MKEEAKRQRARAFVRAIRQGFIDAEREVQATANGIAIAAVMRRVPLGLLDDAIVSALKEIGHAWPSAARESELVRMAMRGAT